MVRLLTALAVLAVLMQGGEAVQGKFDAPSVTCDSLGFQPVFTYNTENEEHDLAIDIDIGGTDDNNTECVASMARKTLNGTEDFEYGDFSTNYTTHIPYMDSTPAAACGGNFSHWTDAGSGNKEYIRYEVEVDAIVTRTFRNKVERKTKYPFKITCLLERVVDGISTNNSFVVATELVDEAQTANASDDFTFAASIKFYSNDGYGTELTDTVITRTNQEKLYLQVAQDANQQLFKFVVNKCYATDGKTIPSDGDAKKDIFFDNQCHKDETLNYAMTNNGEFRFDILSFSFPSATSTIYFHCDLFVCLESNNDPACTQKLKSACPNNRKRRGIARRSVEGVDYEQTVTASQPVLFSGSQIIAPSCGEGFVYDRLLEICSQENILEVRNIRLSQDVFNPDYANTSSLAFKELAKTKEYQLWVLLRTTGQHNIIHGVKLIRARSGSVVLDVAIKYSDTVTAEQAFTTFKQVLYTPASQTRVQNILRITHEKTVEYVPVTRSEKPDTEKLILIVVVVVLFVVVFIAGVTLFKVKQVRQTSATRNASGFDNKGVDA